MDPEEFLNQLRVFGNVYFIGAFSPPITFLSQQIRAFNFIWALEGVGYQFENASIAVIGAGLTGLTMAAALRSVGADVSILERTTDHMPLQQGNQSRFVLPHLYEWPSPGSAYPRTHLPFMNWYAGTAGDIASQIIAQWDQIQHDVEYGINIVRVSEQNNQGCLELENGDTRLFDLVLITVGFGIEDSPFSKHTSPYWRNDDLDQPVIRAGLFSCLVAGTGDGGLTDVLRIALRNFRHGDFLREIVNNQWYRTNALTIQNGINDEVPRLELWNNFIAIDTTHEIEQYLRDSKRENTRVILLGRSESPLQSGGLLCNQIVIALLLKFELIEYWQGDLQNVQRLERDNYWVRINSVVDETVSTEHIFQRVVARLGPHSEIRKVIGKTRYLEMQAAWDALESDETCVQQFPDYFLANNFMPFNFEVSYRVAFSLGTSTDHTNPPTPTTPATWQAVFECVDLLGEQLDLDDLSTAFTDDGVNPNIFEAVREWNGFPFTVRLRNNVVLTNRGLCAGPLVEVILFHREVLDRLLHNDALPYHILDFRITPGSVAGHLENFRDLETNVFVIDCRQEEEPALRVASHVGMHSAHRLLSIGDLSSILRNQWSVARRQEMGWRVVDPRIHLREHWTVWGMQ